METVEAMIEKVEMDADHGEDTLAATEMEGGREATIEAVGSWQRLGDIVDRLAVRIEGG